MVVPAYQKLLEQGRTKFLGYSELEATSRVIGLLIEKQPVDSVPAGAAAELVFDQTPFYAEAGGQVGDHGALYSASGERVADVEGVFPGVPGLSVHRITTHAPIHVGDTLRAEVAAPLRDATRRNHTATHLLHASLRQVLGTHVKQAGSVVEPGRLRFDFTHYAAMDRAELEEVERLMNEQILKNTAVETNVMPLDQAISTGAMALFGEKYGDQVRVVNVPGFSRELCGGTHVGRTGDIGVCKIVYEGSISAGVRRIEAVTGEGALRQYQESADAIKRIADMLKAGEPELVEHVEKLLAAERAQSRQVDHLKSKLAQSAASALESQAHQRQRRNCARGAYRWHGPRAAARAGRFVPQPMEERRGGAGIGRQRWSVDSSRGYEGSHGQGAAGKLVGAVAQAAGGKGGGRPDMAEGGGKDASALEAALAEVYREVESKL